MSSEKHGVIYADDSALQFLAREEVVPPGSQPVTEVSCLADVEAVVSGGLAPLLLDKSP